MVEAAGSGKKLQEQTDYFDDTEITSKILRWTNESLLKQGIAASTVGDVRLSHLLTDIVKTFSKTRVGAF